MFAGGRSAIHSIPVADADDAPGVVLIGMAITFAPIAIVVFAAVLQKLLKNAIDIKSENDLTVWGE